MALPFWVIMFQCILLAQCFTRLPPEASRRLLSFEEPEESAKENKAIFLTPYIENGQIDKGKQAARIKFTEDELKIKSYAGFFTVDKKVNASMYFWYFPPINAPQENAPVIVWLEQQSALYGLYFENGPLKIVSNSYQLRKVNWANDNHMIYIDSPVFTGYSFSSDQHGCSNHECVGNNLHSALTQFFQLFPELQKNNFFIAGTDAAGRYIPALGYTIHNKNQNAKLKINLKGMMFGNALIDVFYQLDSGTFYYQTGLLDENEVNQVKAMEIELQKLNTDCPTCGEALANGTFEMMAFVESTIMIPDTANYLYEEKHVLDIRAPYKDIHVGDLEFRNGSLAFNNLINDYANRKTVTWLSELLNYYKVVVFAGQLDVYLPHSTLHNFVMNFKYSGSEDYKNANRAIWTVGDDVAGYFKTGGNLTEVLMRNAGHYAASDQPDWVLDLVKRMTTTGFTDL